MAVHCALKRLRREGLVDLPTDLNFEQLCRDAGHAWRERLFTPLLTLKCFILQIAWGNTAITHLRHFAGLAFSPSSYSDARSRLPLLALQKLLGRLCNLADEGRGFRLLVVDGSGFSMPDTAELHRHFGMPPRQIKGVGYPVATLMGIMDLVSGMLVETLGLPLFTHDMKGIAQLHPTLRAGDVLVGDRAFCSAIHMMALNLRGVFCVFRLHQRRKVRRCGMNRWERPQKRPVWMEQTLFESLPPWIDVRIIRHVIPRKGYRTRSVFLASTLPPDWSDEQIIDLYQRRWEIETCFGYLKTGMKMNLLKCRSVEGVMKELTVYLLVYNLVRLMMLRWATKQEVDVRRVSFIDTLRLLCAILAGLDGCRELIQNPDRSGRSQLRRIRRRPKKYPLLKSPRRSYKLPEKRGKND